MSREELKEIIKSAETRFEEKTTFENLLFISELLDLESRKYEIENQKEIAFELSKISFKLSKLLEEVF